MFDRLKSVVFAVMVGLIATAALSIWGPVLETNLYPAYSRFTVHSIEPLPGGRSRVQFRFTKLRLCEPAGYAWYNGDPRGLFNQVPIVSENAAPAPSRPLGDQLSSFYVIDVTPETMAAATFAEVFSRCWPLWMTRSIIYP